MKKERILYVTAMIGAVICFVGDNLLGFYKPASDFGSKLLFISFSYEWADASPAVFVAAGFLGVISLLLMFAGFYGVYLRMKSAKDSLSKPFLLSSFVFVSVGTLYHNVFAVAAYTYNRLTQAGYDNAKQFALDLFNKFIVVGGLAALGYAGLVLLLFISAVKGNIYPKKWMCIINPFVFMVLCILLSKVLPQTPLVNGFFGLGQQSMGLFIVFMFLLLTCGKNHTGETEKSN